MLRLPMVDGLTGLGVLTWQQLGTWEERLINAIDHATAMLRTAGSKRTERRWRLAARRYWAYLSQVQAAQLRLADVA